MVIPLFTSVLLGFLPMLFFSVIVYWLDRFEKERFKLLAVVFLWGAIFASAAAFAINSFLGTGIFVISGSELLASTSVITIIAPIVEEAAKGIAVGAIFLLHRNEFDSILDGIIYGAVVGLGFAATENAYYIFTMGYMNDGWSGIWNLAMIRIFMVGWQHPFYTAFIGIGFAVCRMNKALIICATAIPAGLMTAILTHSIHNTLSPFLVSQNIPLAAIFASHADWAGWAIMLVFIFCLIKKEQTIVSTQLLDEDKNQILLPGIYAAAVSKKKQRSIIRQAKKQSSTLSNLYRQYFQLCAELAQKKYQLQRMGNEKNNSETIVATRRSILEINEIINSLLGQ